MTDPKSAGSAPGLTLLGLRSGPLALASRSPRRRELLTRLEIPLLFVDVDVKEGDRAPEEPPADYVNRLAVRKLEAARERAVAGGAYAVLTADTVVVVDGDVLEKPVDRKDAARLLDRISGRWHEVWTGLALEILAAGVRVGAAERSRVFLDLEDAATRDLYISTEEPMDKAGAYGIQGWGGLFVPRIEGDYFNVMGLPLSRLRQLCHEAEAMTGSG